MKFQKLYIEYEPDTRGPKTYWILVIDNYLDLIKYNDFDSEITVNSFMSLPESHAKSHLSERENLLKITMQSKLHNIPEGQKLDPVKVLCDLVDNKFKAQLKLLESGQKLVIHRKGGYCTYDTYFDIWKPKILQEVEKDSVYFPDDEDLPKEIDLLFLENGERISATFDSEIYYRLYKKITGKECASFNEKKVLRLTYLKFQDSSYVIKCIGLAKVIAMETQLVDDVQIDKMMQVFSNFKNKDIIVKTAYKEKLEKHPLYNTIFDNNQVHLI